MIKRSRAGVGRSAGSRAKTEAIEAARQSTTNLTRAFEERIIRSVRAVDQVLRYVRDAYASDPTGFDINQWGAQQRLWHRGFRHDDHQHNHDRLCRGADLALEPVDRPYPCSGLY
jgi:hypothetical protein